MQHPNGNDELLSKRWYLSNQLNLCLPLPCKDLKKIKKQKIKKKKKKKKGERLIIYMFEKNFQGKPTAAGRGFESHQFN